jgi:HAMP domain-containing protein
LESKRVIETIDRLTLRIRDRFPTSDLYEVCRHLYGIAKRTEQTAARIARPVWGLRLVIVALIVVFGVAVGAILINYDTDEKVTLFGVVQAIEAGANVLILLALGAAFLWSIETRIKRSRAIRAINELRDIAHVIDMKQLTKDPDSIAPQARRTIHSPERTLDAYALGRYLDYCTEMLSLTSKLGYLYVENLHDTEVTNAATELENLCTGLSRKVWQKIVILQTRSPIV